MSQPYPYPYGPVPPQQGPHSNGKALAALITGIASLVLSLCCLGFAGIVAVVLGFRARHEIARTRGQQTGSSMALWGIVTGALAMLVSVALVVLLAFALATGNADYTVDTDPSPGFSSDF